jgi:hypothetical protein
MITSSFMSSFVAFAFVVGSLLRIELTVAIFFVLLAGPVMILLTSIDEIN